MTIDDAAPAIFDQARTDHPLPTELSRRALIVGATGAGLAMLAACTSSKSGNTGGNAGTGNGATGNGATGNGSAGSGATGNGSAGSGGASAKSGGSGSGPASSLIALSSVPVGQAKAVTLPDGAPGVVARPSATTAACFSAICTHNGCTVNPEGAKLVCPCHGSQYNALTGAVIQGPAPRALEKVPVKVVNGNVVTS